MVPNDSVFENHAQTRTLEQTFQHKRPSSVISVISVLRRLTFEKQKEVLQMQKLTGLSLTSSG